MNFLDGQRFVNALIISYVLVRTEWLLEYHIAGNFVGGKFSIRQKFSYILGIVYILDKNSMLSGIAHARSSEIYPFLLLFPKTDMKTKHSVLIINLTKFSKLV